MRVFIILIFILNALPWIVILVLQTVYSCESIVCIFSRCVEVFEKLENWKINKIPNISTAKAQLKNLARLTESILKLGHVVRSDIFRRLKANYIKLRINCMKIWLGHCMTNEHVVTVPVACMYIFAENHTFFFGKNKNRLSQIFWKISWKTWKYHILYVFLGVEFLSHIGNWI